MPKGKAEIVKARASLNVERLRVKDDRIALEREWSKLRRAQDSIGQERAETIAALRILCERHGNNDWHDEMPLLDIIDQHLVAPMADLVDRQMRRLDTLQIRLRRAESTPPASPHQQPTLLISGPTPITPSRKSAEAHVVDVVPVPSGRAVPSYQARCRCSWSGPVRPAQHIADADAGSHQRGNRPRAEVRA
jgi:hypothetical protein